MRTDLFNKWSAWTSEMLVGHWGDRYGIAEVRKWHFEVWNEPNLPAFGTGTQDERVAPIHPPSATTVPVLRTVRPGGRPAIRYTAGRPPASLRTGDQDI
jgi:hypothetical protein